MLDIQKFFDQNQLVLAISFVIVLFLFIVFVYLFVVLFQKNKKNNKFLKADTSKPKNEDKLKITIK